MISDILLEHTPDINFLLRVQLQTRFILSDLYDLLKHVIQRLIWEAVHKAILVTRRRIHGQTNLYALKCGKSRTIYATEYASETRSTAFHGIFMHILI